MKKRTIIGLTVAAMAFYQAAQADVLNCDSESLRNGLTYGPGGRSRAGTDIRIRALRSQIQAYEQIVASGSEPIRVTERPQSRCVLQVETGPETGFRRYYRIADSGLVEVQQEYPHFDGEARPDPGYRSYMLFPRGGEFGLVEPGDGDPVFVIRRGGQTDATFSFTDGRITSLTGAQDVRDGDRLEERRRSAPASDAAPGDQGDFELVGYPGISIDLGFAQGRVPAYFRGVYNRSTGRCEVPPPAQGRAASRQQRPRIQFPNGQSCEVPYEELFAFDVDARSFHVTTAEDRQARQVEVDRAKAECLAAATSTRDSALTQEGDAITAQRRREITRQFTTAQRACNTTATQAMQSYPRAGSIYADCVPRFRFPTDREFAAFLTTTPHCRPTQGAADVVDIRPLMPSWRMPVAAGASGSTTGGTAGRGGATSPQAGSAED
jgi:hypothetical protein